MRAKRDAMFQRSAIALCTAFSFFAAGCDSQVEFKYSSKETTNDTIRVTVKRHNDDASVKIENLKTKAAAEEFAFSCAKDETVMKTHLAKAEGDVAEQKARLTGVMQTLDINNLEGAMAKVQPINYAIANAQARVNGFQDVLQACGLARVPA